MDIINIEIKARCSNREQIHERLKSLGAIFKGVDHQIDTYYKTNSGKLKLRRGNIENSLIYYNRPETKELKQSDVILNKLTKDSDILHRQLEAAIGVKTIVDKKRRIYFVDNVKFHLDEVVGLGSFVEIEAIGKTGEEQKLSRQCTYYIEALEISKADFIDKSYSDMFLLTIK